MGLLGDGLAAIVPGGSDSWEAILTDRTTRKSFTALDFAGLDDIGWDLLTPLATVAGRGWYTVIVTLQDDDGGSDVQSLRVHVVAPQPLEISIVSPVIAENAGLAATLAPVSRMTAENAELLVVTLTSGDPSEAAVPLSVTIPAGQAWAAFAIDAVDTTQLSTFPVRPHH